MKPLTNSKFKIQNSKLILLLLLIGFLACSQEEEEKRERPTGIEIRPDVTFARGDGEPLVVYLESQGVVEPNRSVTLQPRLSGYLFSHKIREGQMVQRGDTILKIVDEEWRLRLDEAENAVLKATQEYRIERALRLRDRQGRTNDDLDETDERLLKNQTGLYQAEIAYTRAKLDLSYTTITAPFSGVIHTTEILSPGAYIPAGSQLGQLLDAATVRIRFDVLEAEIPLVRTGMDVEIRAATGTRRTGKVSAISPLVNKDKKTGQIIADVPNPDGVFKTGMTVQGRIQTESFSGRIRAPRGVLLERDGRKLVFRLSGDMVEWVYVEPVAITPEYVVLNEPVFSPGDTLAVDRHFALSHQQRVNVRMR